MNSNHLNWYNDDLLLGNVAGSIITGENDTMIGWVYLYTINQESTLVSTAFGPLRNINQISIKDGRPCHLVTSHPEVCSDVVLFKEGWNYF